MNSTHLCRVALFALAATAMIGMLSAGATRGWSLEAGSGRAGRPLPGAVMTGVDACVHDTAATFESLQKPRLRLEAARCASREGGIWLFEDIHAVISGRQTDGEAEDVVVDASRGELRESGDIRLSGLVEARAGDAAIDMQDLTWDRAANEAWTDNPVTILDHGTRIVASGLRLYPDREEYVLSDATGVVRLNKEEQ